MCAVSHGETTAELPFSSKCFKITDWTDALIFFGESALTARKPSSLTLTSGGENFPMNGGEAVMSDEARLKEVIELLHELKLELVAEMDYASLELQVEAIIDKVYALTESSE